jgi:hypothetical protein
MFVLAMLPVNLSTAALLKGIDRNQIVLPIRLDAVAAEEDRRGRVGRVPNGRLHLLRQSGHPDRGEARPGRGAHQGDAQPPLDGGGCIQAHAHGCVARFQQQTSSLVLVHPGRGILFFRACRETHGGAGENRPRAARGQASGFASAGPGKAGIDARRENRNPGDCAEAGHAGQPRRRAGRIDQAVGCPNSRQSERCRGHLHARTVYAKNRNFSAIKDFR